MAANTGSYGASALKSTGPSISMVESSAGSVGVGNYKGVMLCNRPFGGTAVSSKMAGGGGGKTTFNCGVVPESTGLNVPISAKEKLVKRPNPDSVLAKHKKWLADLQKNNDRLEIEFLEEAKRKEEQQRKFQEQQRKMREASRQILHGADSKEDYKAGGSEYVDESGTTVGPATEDDSSLQAQAKSAGGSKVQFKPAWAMTEKAADDQVEEMKSGEEDALLEFAQGLDFDRYIGDIEVQTMMERLRKRIIDLERDVALEEMKNADAETRALLREKLAKMGATEASLQVEGAAQSAESEAMVAARALLQEEEDLQAVHSAKSAAALLKTAKDKISQVTAAVHPPEGPPAEPRVLNEPVMITHEPSEGTRLNGKNEISNLPYMRRNPAV
mmetsp:Transcript_16732/g.28367  ORF Transcript_16732/g.28367 Transcript_16732/m.28367 type:complete len:387 (+) Transcript_16732:42-1202(+)